MNSILCSTLPRVEEKARVRMLVLWYLVLGKKIGVGTWYSGWEIRLVPGTQGEKKWGWYLVFGGK